MNTNRRYGSYGHPTVLPAPARLPDTRTAGSNAFVSCWEQATI